MCMHGTFVYSWMRPGSISSQECFMWFYVLLYHFTGSWRQAHFSAYESIYYNIMQSIINYNYQISHRWLMVTSLSAISNMPLDGRSSFTMYLKRWVKVKQTFIFNYLKVRSIGSEISIPISRGKLLEYETLPPIKPTTIIKWLQIGNGIEWC